MALVTLNEYAEAHGLKVSNVRSARQRGKMPTAVKRHGVWMVDDAEPWWRERRKEWYDPEVAKVLGDAELDANDVILTIKHYAHCGKYGETFARCLGMIPDEVREALPAQQVAALVDAIHDSYEAGYRAGLRDAG
ncbi:MAG: hypothetical protein U0N15_02365 [Bifidobacterium choerinum]